MAKEKDPAFLFYSKDWIEGTAEFMPNEKGVFIDLLAHQHQKTGLPTDLNRLARLVGLSLSEFTEIWKVISEKFTEVDGRFFNNRLLKVMNERGEKGKKNTIIGIFSGILRKEKPSKKEYNFIKNSFNAENFMQFDSERLSERISEWYKERLKSIVNGNEDEDGNENKTEVKKETKKTAEIFYPFESENFMQKWSLWKQYKKEQFNFSYKSIGEQAALKDLANISGGIESTAIYFIENAIAKNWKGIYKPNEQKSKNNEPRIYTAEDFKD